MAAKKKKAKASADLAERLAASAAPASAGKSDREPIPARVWVFVALDLALAALYFALGRLVVSSEGTFEAMTSAMAFAVAGAGIGLVARRPWGWWLSLAGCAVVLLGALVLLTVLAASVGFLWGSFGALGKGAASMSLVIMALIVELYVLVPAFQLAWLLSARGRALAGRA